MNPVIKFFYDKNELSLLKIMVAASLVLHVVAVLVLSRYGLAKPGRRIVTVKMVQQQQEALKTGGNKGSGSSAGGGKGSEPSQAKAARPAPSAPSAAPAPASVDAIRQAVSKKGILSALGKKDLAASSSRSTASFEGAFSRAGTATGGTGGGGSGTGTGTGKDEWAGMGMDTGGFAAAEGESVASAQGQKVSDLKKSRDLKVESAEAAKSQTDAVGLTNKEVLEIIKRTVESYVGGLRYSYNKQLRKNPDLQGTVTVAITINNRGQVVDARVTETTMNNSEMESEIISKIRHWTFPAVVQNTLTVTYPFVFFPPT